MAVGGAPGALAQQNSCLASRLPPPNRALRTEFEHVYAYSKFNLSAETLKMMDRDRKFQMMQGEAYQFAQFDDPSVEDEYKGDDLVHKRSRCLVAMLIHVIGIVLHTFFTLTPEYAAFDFQVLGPDLEASHKQLRSVVYHHRHGDKCPVWLFEL